MKKQNTGNTRHASHFEVSSFTVAVKFNMADDQIHFPLFLTIPGTEHDNTEKICNDFSELVVNADDDARTALIDRIVSGEKFAPMEDHPDVVMNCEGAYWVHQMNHLITAGFITEEQKEAAIQENKFGQDIPSDEAVQSLADSDVIR